jgi:hypothetical protein
VFSELVTTTYRNHKKTLADNITNNNALLRRLKDKGMTRMEDGGTTITMPLEYAQNGTYQRYSGFDVLNVAASDVFTAAEFPWCQIAVNVVASGRDMRINSGAERIINLAKARLKNAMNTLANNFSFDLYSDGTAANQINGLQALVADSGQGVVGGIDASVWTFWRNQVQSAAAPIGGGAAVTPSPTTIELQLMLPLYMALTRGNDKPDLIVADNNYFAMYEASQVSLKRYTTDSGGGSANGGFQSLKYKGADVIFDGNSGIPANRMYFLNTDYIELVAHQDANMTVNDEVRPYNQDATVIPILWMGNMDVSNRHLQGVLKP